MRNQFDEMLEQLNTELIHMGHFVRMRLRIPQSFFVKKMVLLKKLLL